MRKHIIDQIRAHAQSRPRECALGDSRIQLDYSTLSRFSTVLARRLRALGCEMGSRVVMLAGRRAITVAAILGTLESGCIHVPLDPRMPTERLQYILNDIKPALVIVDEDLCDTVVALAPSTQLLTVCDLELLLATSAADYLLHGSAPTAPLPLDATAYCIYTSGSTGRPKGVLIGHDSIAHFFEGTRAVYDVRHGSVCASFSPLHFDVFLMDMLFPLAQGARLHVHDDVIAPDLLFETLRSNGVTHFSAWGRMLGLITQAADFGTAPLPRLQTVLTGTEVPDVKTVQLWLEKTQGVRVINAYGPTEATCAATAHVIRDAEPNRRQLYPIGRPLEHVQTFLVDSHGAPVTSAAVPGELLIGGPQVMRGYWNLAEETAARLTEFHGVRCYRTGDVCTYLPDGSLHYLGRRDHEVKIGGYRVHLNEIQRVINSVPHVHASEIVLMETLHGEKVLGAGVILERVKQGHLQLERIEQRLRQELPSYMVPRYLTALDDFPQLSSGKTDRQRLQSLLESRMNHQTQEVRTA